MEGRELVFILDILPSPPAVLAVVYFGAKSSIIPWQISNPYRTDNIAVKGLQSFLL